MNNKMNNKMNILKLDVFLIVEKSLSYPSGDNSQPLSFVFTKSNSLKIFIDKSEIEGPFGVTALNFTLGCFLEILTMRAQQAGYEIEVDAPANFCQSSLPVEIHFKKNASNNSNTNELFYHEIDLRHTDRRSYLKNNIENEIKKILISAVDDKKPENIQLKYVNKLSKNLLTQLYRVERKIWSKYFFVKLICKGINYELRPSKKMTGLNIYNLGVNPLIAFLGILESNFEWVFKLNVLLGRPWLNHFIFRNQILNSGGFCLVTIQDKTQQEIINAGKIACRVWIKTCGQGYSVQPISVASMLPFSLRQQNFQFKASDLSLNKSFSEVEMLLKKDFSLNSTAEIIWMFRVGIPKKPLEKFALTRRKNITDVWTEE